MGGFPEQSLPNALSRIAFPSDWLGRVRRRNGLTWVAGFAPELAEMTTGWAGAFVAVAMSVLVARPAAT